MLNEKKPLSQKQIGWLMEHKKKNPSAITKISAPKAPKAPKISPWEKIK